MSTVSRATLAATITNSLASAGANGIITAATLRSVLTDVIDSFHNPTTDGAVALASALTAGLAGKADASHNHTALQISDSTTIGRSVLTAADAAAVRTAIGAGTSNFDGAYSSLSGVPSTFTPATHAHTASNVTDFDSVSRAQTEAALVAGSNITLTPSGSGASRQITIASTGGGLSNPMTTAGDLIVGGASGVPARLAISTEIGAFPGVNQNGTVEYFGDTWAVVSFDILNMSASTAASSGTGATSGIAGSVVGSLGGEGNTMIITGGTTGTTGACRFWNGGNAIGANRGGIRLSSVVYAEIRTRIYMANISDGTDTYTVPIGWGRIFTNAATAMTNFVGANINASGQIVAMNRASSVDTLGSTYQLANATTYALRVTFDGTTTNVYIDGTLRSSVSTGLPAGTTTMVPTFQIIKTAGATARTVAFGTGAALIKYTP